MIRLPSIFVLRPLVTSLLVIWIACHLALSAVLMVGSRDFQTLWPQPTASILLVPVVPFLFFLDLRIKRLDVFLANLGVSRQFLFLSAFFFALGLEVLGTVVARYLISGSTG